MIDKPKNWRVDKRQRQDKSLDVLTSSIEGVLTVALQHCHMHMCTSAQSTAVCIVMTSKITKMKSDDQSLSCKQHYNIVKETFV